MPKRRKDRQVRGEDVRRRIRDGRLSAFPFGTPRVLAVHEADRGPWPPVWLNGREIRERRMTISAGSFLNSRWIRVNKTWDIWPNILAAKTPEEIAALRARSIINVEGVWYVQIYEVVSGVNKLRRQRVKVRANYHQERTRRSVVMDSIERDIARDAIGQIRLSRVERRSLESLSLQIERRIQDIDVIGAQLSSREVFAYAGGWAELETLRRTRSTLQLAARQALVQAFKPNFDHFLAKIADDLDVIVDLDVRHNRFWAQYHIRRAAAVLVDGPQEKCHPYLNRAIDFLDRAVETLQGWATPLSEEEKRHVISA